LTDYFVPNESEAAAIVGFEIETEQDARRAGEEFLKLGVKTALITLGEKGVYIHSPTLSRLIPAISNAPAIDTSGAGDAFIGGFATALSEGLEVEAAVQFGCATAGIAVTRRGTAPAMPTRDEIDALLRISEGRA
jgi:ribokinase